MQKIVKKISMMVACLMLVLYGASFCAPSASAWSYTFYKQSSGYYTASTTVSYGSNNTTVRCCQAAANYIITAKLSVDGAFGYLTQDAVTTFQSRRGLQIDGICGVNTFGSMKSGAGTTKLTGLN